MISDRFKQITLAEFTYPLSEERIAQKPMERRDESRLLVYREGKIHHTQFSDLPLQIPEGSRLIVNNARVIPARLRFYRQSGARIEVFLLEPQRPFSQMERVLSSPGPCTWVCMIGNAKRWKEGEILMLPLSGMEDAKTLSARLISKQESLVELSWEGRIPFSRILDGAGKTPLPPYIKREAGEADAANYQTVFAKEEGAVAAPTAGLHFSPRVFEALEEKRISRSELTLYVGAGTFAPVTVEKMADHDMHAEMISVKRDTLLELMHDETRIAVGTTSLRTLESLYWIGVKLHLQEKEPLEIEKLYPYGFEELPLSWNEALQELVEYLDQQGLNAVQAKTAIMIMPGYRFLSVKGLITNFHSPQTTLIMLVASFIGADWRKVYDEALQQQYRFLSYGDSSLLWKP